MNRLKVIKEQAYSGEVVWVTPAGKNLLRERVAKLRVEQKKLEEDLSYAGQDYPDLRENATYGDIKVKLEVELPKLMHELRELQTQTREYTARAADCVDLGSSFVGTVEWANGHESCEHYQLVGPIEATYMEGTNATLISYLSPLGKVAWGMKAGATAAFKGPRGTATLRVDELS